MGTSADPVDRSELFGPEGRDALADHGHDLFPAAVLPPFMRLIWIGLAITAVAAALAVAALAGRLG